MNIKLLGLTACLCLLSFSSYIAADSTLYTLDSKIYTYVPVQDSCILLLNTNSEIGCSSSKSGSVGVLYLMETDAEFNFFINSASNKPYVVLMPPTFFNSSIVAQLEQSGKMNGLLIIPGSRPSGDSPSVKCPNCASGLYQGTPLADYSWNPTGSGFNRRRFNFPIYTLDAASTNIVKPNAIKNAPVGGVEPGYPLWAVKMDSFMYAAKDSQTCLRRGNEWCEPLGSQSIIATARKVTSNDKLVIASAPLDASSFFHRLSGGADAHAASIVALFAAAEALGKNTTTTTLKNNIVFSVFNGEQFDNIGSSKMAFDLNKRQFSSNLSLDSIKAFIDVEQIGLRKPSDPVYVHIDSQSPVDDLNADLFSTIQTMAGLGGVTVTLSNHSNTGLPPASFQSFLQLKRSIPGVVIAEHDTEFKNTFYGSTYDDAVNIGSTDTTTVDGICDTATLLARTLYSLAAEDTNIAPGTLAANCTLVSQLLSCLTVNYSCPLFQSVSGSSVLTSGVVSRYVSVYRSNTVLPLVASLYKLLTRFVAVASYNMDETTCQNSGYTYIAPGICVNSSTTYYGAISPSFDFNNFRILNTDYPLWSESVWEVDPTLSMFLIDSYKNEVMTILVGFAVFVASFILTWFARAYFVKTLKVQ